VCIYVRIGIALDALGAMCGSVYCELSACVCLCEEDLGLPFIKLCWLVRANRGLTHQKFVNLMPTLPNHSKGKHEMDRLLGFFF
jgi:hypothetical protein